MKVGVFTPLLSALPLDDVLKKLKSLDIDTVEFGEVPGIHHGIHDLNMWNWLSLGYTPIGVEVWNAIRALDYLEKLYVEFGDWYLAILHVKFLKHAGS